MPSPSPQRTRTNDPAGLRARVLDAAAEAFQGSGYRGTSMQDIVAAAGVTGGALHHHFPTKARLARAVVEERVAHEVDQTWIAAVEAAPTAAAGVLQVFDTVADALAANRTVLGCPLGNLAAELALTETDVRSAIADEYGTWRDAIAARFALEKAQGARLPGDLEPTALAGTAVALFTGAMTIAKAEQSERALRECTAVLHALLQA